MEDSGVEEGILWLQLSGKPSAENCLTVWRSR
jgi:hypothetical protein